MFINATPVLSILEMYRLIWISGRFGGHKTALSFKIAEDYLKRGYRLITNSKSVWNDEIENTQLDENGHLKTVVILDEGGLYFKASKQIEQIASYAAKMDVIYIIPSFWPPARMAQVINIQPIISLKSAGIPAIIYKWRVDLGGFHDKGWFVWVNPAEVYGIYSRQDPGSDPETIIRFLTQRTTEYRKRYGHEDSLSKLVEVKPEDIIAESIENFSTAAEQLETISWRKNRGR